jgi:hypothetical protein
MFNREVPEISKYVAGFRLSILAHEPKRALVEEEPANKQYTCGNELKAHGDLPAFYALSRNIPRYAIVDPEAGN